ncbi:MAG: SDR family oxidoreductase [Candidatus Levybacteria bacterium]|nr:SDR family oxidoreductase [Candidatus Levybacteria bacterium]MBI3093040.1 SDR family oxidoreductase [Candidatus Levybacteria bacterium]
MKILGTGLSGLVGSRIIELLKERHEFDSSEVDITDRDKITEKIKTSNASIVLHLAAKTDVDGCEIDKDSKEQGEAWRVNVLGTKNVALACSISNKKLIYISTDFVFDGENSLADGYKEEDRPNPINWYGQTKYGGEKIVQNSNLPWLIVRIAYPYRANFAKGDFARGIIAKLKRAEKISAITDHIMTPTFIDDIAYALDIIIQRNVTGIFHLVGSQFISPFEAAVLISNIFNFDKNLIQKTTRGKYFKDRAQRPFRLALKNDKIQQLDIKMRTFEEGLDEIKKQMESL